MVKSINEADVFSENWQKARDLFQKNVLLVGGEYHEIPTCQRGPQGEELVISVGVVSFRDGRVVTSGQQNIENLILHISGVHGVEGFAGCAAQSNWLERLIRDGARVNQSRDHTVVMIHCANPWGMSWLRRVNSNNVDLNRNVLDSYADPFDDPNAGHANSVLYSKVGHILTARDWKKVLWLPRLAFVAATKGVGFVTQAFSGGQLTDPHGFYYAGRQLQPEVRAVQEFLENRFRNIKYIFAIDVHTGLGPYAVESLFTHHAVSSHEVESLSNLLGRRISHNEVDGKPSYLAAGEFSTLFFSAFKEANVRFVLQEFGTFSGFRILRGFYDEHHHWISGKFGPGTRASEAFKELFNPPDAGWRRTVLAKSMDLMDLVQQKAFG